MGKATTIGPGHRRSAWHSCGTSALLLLALLAPATARAQDDSLLGLGIEVHGFASQGFIYTTDNQFLARSEQGSFEFSEVGINFTKTLTDKLRVGIQLFSRDLGPIGNYGAEFDWYYVDYRFFDWFGLRVGRTKVPGGLYNETSDIDAARAPILLPQSIYPVENRDILLAQTGVDIYGYLPLGGLGALDYRVFGGAIHYEPPVVEANIEYSVPYTVGARAQWFTPIEGLSLAISGIQLQVDQKATFEPEDVETLKMLGFLSPENEGHLENEIPIAAWTASIEYSAHNLLLAAEYSRTRMDLEMSEPLLRPLLFPNGWPYPVRGRNFYVMAAYRLAPWFTPGAYYSVSQPNVERKGRNDSHRKDLALFVRYDLNENWLLKLEGHYMSGTAGLNYRLNELENEDALKDLTRTWGAFLAKVTAYF